MRGSGSARPESCILSGQKENAMSVAKVIELVGSSSKGWEDAAQAAIRETSKTIRGITGLA